MNRINQTIKKNQKKTKSNQKEIPTFGVDGNVIIPGKKERQKKIKKVVDKGEEGWYDSKALLRGPLKGNPQGRARDKGP